MTNQRGGLFQSFLSLGQVFRLFLNPIGRILFLFPGDPLGQIDLGPAVLLSPDMAANVARILARHPGLHMLFIMGSVRPGFREIIAKLKENVDNPLDVALNSLPEQIPEEYNFLAEQGIPVYPNAPALHVPCPLWPATIPESDPEFSNDLMGGTSMNRSRLFAREIGLFSFFPLEK